jgi:hypothetical protein
MNFGFMINFALCLIIVNAHGWGDIFKMWGQIQLSLCPRPLILEKPPPWGFTLHIISLLLIRSRCEICCKAQANVNMNINISRS